MTTFETFKSLLARTSGGRLDAELMQEHAGVVITDTATGRTAECSFAVACELVRIAEALETPASVYDHV